MRNKVRINQGRIIMWQFRLAGTFIVLFLMLLAIVSLPEIPGILTAIFISFLIPFIWHSYTIFEVDPTENLISEYYWVAGLRLQEEKQQYESLEKIFINAVSMGQTFYSYSGKAHNARSIEYHAFLKLTDGKKFFMLSDGDPERLKKRLGPIAKKLNCVVITNYE